MNEYQPDRGTQGAVQRAGAFVIKNVSGEEIPCYATCQISQMTVDATTGGKIFEVVKPTADGNSHVLFTAGHTIAAAAETQMVLPKATLDHMYGGIRARYSGADPAVGDGVGAKAGKWTLEAGSGFLVLGVDTIAKLVYIRPAGGGGGASIQIVQATADGNAGVVPVKAVTLKANVALSPNFEQATGDPVNVNYFRI